MPPDEDVHENATDIAGPFPRTGKNARLHSRFNFDDSPCMGNRHVRLPDKAAGLVWTGTIFVTRGLPDRWITH
jgi:hypothetical protein